MASGRGNDILSLIVGGLTIMFVFGWLMTFADCGEAMMTTPAQGDPYAEGVPYTEIDPYQRPTRPPPEPVVVPGAFYPDAEADEYAGMDDTSALYLAGGAAGLVFAFAGVIGVALFVPFGRGSAPAEVPAPPPPERAPPPAARREEVPQFDGYGRPHGYEPESHQAYYVGLAGTLVVGLGLLLFLLIGPLRLAVLLGLLFGG